MSIGLIVTRGLGNGTQSGSIAGIILEGFTSGAALPNPVLSSPTATATGTTTGSGSVTADIPCNGYFIATTVSGTPTDIQIMAGNDSSGTATAVIDDNHSSPASWTTGVNNFSIINGTAGTLYYVYSVGDNGGSTSNVVGASFTTFSTGGGSGTARVTSSGGLRGVKVL